MGSNIGGYYVDLKLVSDTASFAQGFGKLAKTESMLKSIGGILAKGFALTGAVTVTAGIIGKHAADMNVMAQKLGVSARYLETIKQGWDAVQLSGDGFLKTVEKINEEQKLIQFGDVNDKTVLALSVVSELAGKGKLGADYVKGADATKLIFEALDNAVKAYTKKGQSKQAKDQIEGAMALLGIRDYFSRLLNLNTTTSGIVSKGEGTRLTTDKDIQQLDDYGNALNEAKNMADEFTKAIIVGFSGKTSSALKSLMYGDNLTDKQKAERMQGIRSAGEGFGVLLGDIALSLKDLVEGIALLVTAINNLTGGALGSILFGSKGGKVAGIIEDIGTVASLKNLITLPASVWKNGNLRAGENTTFDLAQAMISSYNPSNQGWLSQKDRHLYLHINTKDASGKSTEQVYDVTGQDYNTINKEITLNKYLTK